MKVIRGDKEYVSYGSLVPGETFEYEGKILMIIGETDKSTSDITYEAVNLETGVITLAFANGTMVLKTNCEVKVKYQ